MAQPVFRDYDQPALDAEYNNRAKVKDAADWLLRYARESEQARRELPCRLDLAYGPGAGEAFDGALPADVLQGGCGISGLYDLEPIRLCYLNEILTLTPASARRNSPVHHPPKRSSPLLLALGALEGPEYERQSRDLAEVWRDRGLRVEVLDLPGHHHFSSVAELLDPTSPLSRRLAAQMGLA